MTYSIGIYDHETGEEITREMTAEEAEAHEAQLAASAADEAAQVAERQAKEAARLAVLEKLGLTPE